MEKVTSSRNRLSSTVLKAMSIFGSVQMVHIVCSVIRTKLVALFIGPAGVGLFGIFNSAIEMVSNLTQLGVGSSSVRNIAMSADENHANLVIRVVRRLGWILGGLGAITIMVTAPLLSKNSFGDTGHAWQFQLLAVCMMLNAVTATNVAVMQGLKRYRNLARTSLCSAIGGIAVSAPLYYFLGINSIIPSLIGASLAGFAAMLFNRPKTPSTPLTTKIIFDTGRSILTLGFFMTVTGFCNYFASYIFISWLNIHSGVEAAGHFQAGYTLFNKYAGLIFSSLAVEYYPRLASVAKSAIKTRSFVNHETLLLQWILMPVIILFILFAPILVRLLYSAEFIEIVPLVTIGIVGTTLRAVSWCMAFTILARGDGKIYLATELISSALYVALNIAGYKIGGLAGIGVAYIIWYAMYTISIGIVYRRFYGLHLGRNVIIITASGFFISVVAAGIALATSLWWLNIILAVSATAVSFFQLKRLY